MDILSFLITSYDRVLAVFPEGFRWLVTLLILIGLVAGTITLIRKNVLFAILLIILLPILIPAFGSLLRDIYAFFLFLVAQFGSSAPRP